MLQLTERAQVKSLEPLQQGQLILEIDGIDRVFGSYDIKRIPRIGDEGLLIGNDWKIGGVATDPNSKMYINLEGSSKILSQQINQDDGGSGSVGSIFVELIDPNSELTEMIAAEVGVDLLGRNAQVYFGFKDTAHPDDSVLLISGVISEIEAKIGSYVFKIKHPEEKKKTKIFTPIQGTILNAIGAYDYTFKIDTFINWITQADRVETDLVGNPLAGILQEKYLKIDDEIMKLTYVADASGGAYAYSDNFYKTPADNVPSEGTQGEYTVFVERGALGTSEVAHQVGAEFTTLDELKGGLVDLSLSLMLSQHEPIEATAQAINQVEPTKRVQNALLFFENVKEIFGLVEGDKVLIGGEVRLIESFGASSMGNTVILSGFPLATSLLPTPIKFKSKYNKLYGGIGCGMTTQQVDVAEHEKIQKLYGSALLSYSFLFDDEIEAQELINEQIYHPAGCFQLPRKGKASMGIARAPMAEEGTIEINSSNVINVSELRIVRSTSENFYNSVTYRYQYDLEADKYYAVSKHISADSVNKIRVAEKSLEIEAKGLKRNGVTKEILDINAKRFLDRYKFAAEMIADIKVNQKTGFRVEVGDIVLFGDHMMRMADLKNGSRSFEPRLMEVQNKSFDIKTGQCTITLLDTSFESNGRYGTVAPSSLCIEGSTATALRLKNGLSVGPRYEKEKWERYIGESIEVHSEDILGTWTRRATATILGFDNEQTDVMLISALPWVPNAGDIVMPAPYPASPKQNRMFKALTCYINPSVQVASGISSTKFTVSEADAAKLLVGATIMLHNEDYSSKSPEVKIKEITGTTLTVGDLGFTPDNTHTIELIGFIDGGKPYRLL